MQRNSACLAAVAVAVAVLVVLAGHAAPARADNKWMDLAKSGTRVTDLDRVVWALTASCDKGEDLSRRQCKFLRDGAAARLKGATIVVDAGPGSIEIGAFDPATKASPVIVRGCLSCTGVESEGKTWYVVANAGVPKIAGDKVEAAEVHQAPRAFPDEAAATAWRAATGPRLRAQLVVKMLETNYTWTRGSAQGIAVQVVGYRVYDACDGAIVVASPQSGPGPADKATCGAVAKVEPVKVVDPRAGLPAQLTKTQILAGLRPAVELAQACYETHGVAGDARVKVTIGGHGTVLAVKQSGPLAGTPTGDCIDAAIKTATFPHSRKDSMTITYPVSLR